MIKFRRKNFTIPEGHYTGHKDLDKVPGFIEMVGKSALTGAGIGAVVGGFSEDSSILSGATTGGKYGSITGILLKFFLNHLHNPMSSVKYQEVDKLIRREFGILSLSGITIGDSLDKRNKLEDSFGFNDRNVSSYKLNFAIQDNSVTMYTLGLTDKELDTVSNSLDYYCKKYFGMEYSSSLINKKLNSYSVSIIFTNYQVISNFIMELSKKLNTKINLLDNKALAKQRILDSTKEEKTFSVKEINKYDLINILGNSSSMGLSSLCFSKEPTSSFILGMIVNSLNKLKDNELIRLGSKRILRSSLNNLFLEKTLNRLGKIEGFNYTVGELNSNYNISIVSGLFILTIDKKDKYFKLINKKISNLMKNLTINRSEVDNIIVYTYPVKSKNELEYLLRNILSINNIKFNIFER